MIYKTIQANGLTQFNERCEKMVNDGYSPMFNVCMVLANPNTEGDPVMWYSQQWMKAKP